MQKIFHSRLFCSLFIHWINNKIFAHVYIHPRKDTFLMSLPKEFLTFSCFTPFPHSPQWIFYHFLYIYIFNPKNLFFAYCIQIYWKKWAKSHIWINVFTCYFSSLKVYANIYYRYILNLKFIKFTIIILSLCVSDQNIKELNLKVSTFLQSQRHLQKCFMKSETKNLNILRRNLEAYKT